MAKDASHSQHTGILSAESIERHEAQSTKRRKLFLKGPIKFGWVQQNIPDPTSRVVLVARAFMDMSKTDECKLNAKVWSCARVDGPDQRRRVLRRLRTLGGEFEVVDRPGKSSILRRKTAVSGVA